MIFDAQDMTTGTHNLMSRYRDMAMKWIAKSEGEVNYKRKWDMGASLFMTIRVWVGDLRPLATKTTGELKVLGLNGDTLSMDRGKVG